MNVYQLIEFYIEESSMNRVNRNELALFVYLLYRANKVGWKNPFQVSTRDIANESLPTAPPTFLGTSRTIVSSKVSRHRPALRQAILPLRRLGNLLRRWSRQTRLTVPACTSGVPPERRSGGGTPPCLPQCLSHRRPCILEEFFHRAYLCDKTKLEV